MDLLTNISLFSGVGGLDLAAKWTSRIKTVCYVEKDRYAQGVLMSRIRDGSLDDAPIWDDVTTFDGRPWRGRVDCISGGFPCQPHSIAGAVIGRKGGQDKRNLWPDYKRIVEEIKPTFILAENVPGIFDTGYAIEVMASLEEIGYWTEPLSICACEVGAPHPRQRVFFLSYPMCFGWDLLDQNKENFSSGNNKKSMASWGNAPFDLSPAMDGIRGEPSIGVLRVDDGLAEGMDRLRCCGNGVVPQQALPAWEEIIRLSQ